MGRMSWKRRRCRRSFVTAFDNVVEDQLVCIYGVVSYIAVSVNIVVDKYDFFIERCNKFKSFGRNFRNDQSVQFRKLLLSPGVILCSWE